MLYYIIVQTKLNIKEFSRKMVVKNRISGVICEFNPLHNGHAALLRHMRAAAGGPIVCAMSGNFVQRGEAAALDKWSRARLALQNGADLVLELPLPWALAGAERFAFGGVSLLNALGADTLFFGSECGETAPLMRIAEYLLSAQLADDLRPHLAAGLPFAAARTRAIEKALGAECAALCTQPNNILGIEYCKALRAEGSDAAVLPVPRRGAGYADEALHPRFSSAAAIRAALAEGNTAPLRGNLPDFVLDDLARRPDTRAFRTVAVYAALALPPEKLRAVLDCTEGLENRLRALARETPDYEDVVRGATGKRYIASRIRRILAAAALDIEGKLVRESLRAALYLNVLAVRKSRADELLPALAGGAFPALLRGGDEQALSPEAARCLEADRRAEDVYAAVTRCSPPLGRRTLFV